MIFAIPSREGAQHNHFAKAPQMLIVDDTTQQQTLIDIPETISHCGKKKVFMDIISQHHVEAVVVRQIGESMLKNLFDNHIKVFACPRGRNSGVPDLSLLEEVTDLSYAKPSPNKQQKGHHGCHHKHRGEAGKLSPATFGKLKQIFKIHQ